MAPSALALQDPPGLAMLGDCSRSLTKVLYPDCRFQQLLR